MQGNKIKEKFMLFSKNRHEIADTFVWVYMAKWILRYRIYLFSSFLILTIIGIAGIFRLNINFSFDRFFPDRDEDVIFFREYEKWFPQNDQILYIAVESPDSTVFDRHFLQTIKIMEAQLGMINHIDSIVSLLSIPEIKYSPTGFKTRRLMDIRTHASIIKSRKKLMEDDFLRQAFVSRSESWLSLFISLDSKILDTGLRDVTYDSVRAILERSGYNYKISGVPGIRTEYIRKVSFELFLFVSLSVILILLFLLLIFRSWWGVLFPILGVIFPVVWLLGIMGWLDMELDLLTTLLPSLLFIVGTSDVIHLLSRYLQEIRKGRGRLHGLMITLNEMGWITFLTSFSTAVSLASLQTSALEPLRLFGLYASVGVMLAFLITFMMLPALLMLIPVQSIRMSETRKLIQISWNSRLGGIIDFSFRNRKKVIWLALIMVIMSIHGSSRISMDVKLLDDIGADDPIRRQLDFFEKEFTGVRNLEIAIEPKAGINVNNLPFLQTIEKLARYVEKSEECHATQSLPGFYSRANKIWHFNQKKYDVLPSDTLFIEDVSRIADGEPALLQVLREDKKMTRISSRMKDLGSEAMQDFTHRLKVFADTETDTALYSYRLTGTAILFEKNNAYLVSGLFTSLLLSACIIALGMGTLFQSFRMLLISFIPNLFPILILGGIMGYFGIGLKASTVIVTALSFGIAFDDTIHFLGRLKLELKKKHSNRISLIKSTLQGCGEGLFLTTGILTAGFLILTGSDFGGTYYIGLFCCVTLISALMVDVFVLPLLIYWFMPESLFEGKSQ